MEQVISAVVVVFSIQVTTPQHPCGNLTAIMSSFEEKISNRIGIN